MGQLSGLPARMAPSIPVNPRVTAGVLPKHAVLLCVCVYVGSVLSPGFLLVSPSAGQL